MADYSAVGKISIRDVLVGDRLREVDYHVTPGLEQSIAKLGLLNPILVRNNPNRDFSDDQDQLRIPAYILVAGAHRLAACKKLGWDEIPAIVMPVADEAEARLMEVDENFARADLCDFDKAVFLAERKKIYENLHPETKQGAKGGRGGQKEKNAIFSFSKATAQRLGCSKRLIELNVKIAKDMDPGVRKRLDAFKHGFSQKDLLALVALSPEKQAEVAGLMETTETGKMTLAQAIRAVTGGGEKAAPSDDQQYATLLALWGRTGAAARARFQAWLDAGQPEADQDEAA